jgi:cytochrome c oxidase subunit 2
MARAAPAACLLLGGCEGVQSTLAPSGPQAHHVAQLFWVMVAGSAAIMLAVSLLTAIALFASARRRAFLAGDAVILAGGLVFPVVTLSALLVYGLIMLGAGPDKTTAAPVRIEVAGERWWWRVVYRDEAGSTVESANELRIPVGRAIEIELTSDNVIHSFWAPRLAGKLDMIPGRKTKLTLSAGKAGVSRGQCAEYCGGAHALMAFNVVALPQQEYDDWRLQQFQPAQKPATPESIDGEALFLSRGCGACHTIRGTPAAGRLGPDLTHVGGRISIGAATLAADEASIARWIRHNQEIKPGNLMPAYDIFSDSELLALSRYLASLR